MRAVNLPSYHDMLDSDMDRVVGALKQVMAEAER
jgi:dTDP-4-amino-4,6-dideoxygalactose transaminase